MTAEAQQTQGDSTWASEQLRAGRPVRSLGWFRGSIHPHTDAGLEGQAFFRSEDPSVPTASQDTHIGRWDIYFGKHQGDLWEHADIPRRTLPGRSTVLDLALFPAAMPAVTVMEILAKCEEAGDDFARVIEVVWTHAGQSMIGKALRALLSDERLRQTLAMARNGDRAMRTVMLDAIRQLRDGR